MEGVFVYWFGWMLWGIITFFGEKTNRRLLAAMNVLMLLIIIPLTVHVQGIEINLAFACLSLYCCYRLRAQSIRKLCYLLLVSSFIAASYAAFIYLSMIDPVVLFVDQRLYLSVITAVIALLLFRSWANRFLVSTLGLIQGELGLVLAGQGLLGETAIGRLLFFLMCWRLVFCSLLVFFSIRQFSLYMNRVLLERKQKSFIESAS